MVAAGALQNSRLADAAAATESLKSNRPAREIGGRSGRSIVLPELMSRPLFTALRCKHLLPVERGQFGPIG